MEGKLLKIDCPVCGSIIWIDVEARIIVKHEKAEKKKSISLEELIEKEKKKSEEFERKFESVAELQKEKKKELEEKFRKKLKEQD
ncbi:MAG: hypothetical protein ACUVUG_01890 [Candidatus Aminicenantia bacterium]